MLTVATLALSLFLPFLAPTSAYVNTGIMADGNCQVMPGGNPPSCG